MEIGCLDVDLFEGKNALRSRSGWVIPVSSITLVCSITFFSSQAFVEKKYGGMAVWSIGWLTSLVEHLHPSLHLVPTKPGSACLWSLSSRTGWSMLWPIVKLFQSWCSVKLWLMARSGLTRHIHLDSWMLCRPRVPVAWTELDRNTVVVDSGSASRTEAVAPCNQLPPSQADLRVQLNLSGKGVVPSMYYTWSGRYDGEESMHYQKRWID